MISPRIVLITIASLRFALIYLPPKHPLPCGFQPQISGPSPLLRIFQRKMFDKGLSLSKILFMSRI
ncbi:MAG: hypothetical protein ACKPJF_26065, partial [Dolichospermum sp.]